MNMMTRPITGEITSTAFVDDVRAHLYAWQQQGLKTALVTLVNYEGSSPRPIGSQVAVNERGESVGLISGGCLEANILNDALHSLEDNQQKLIRYGKDSDFIDIQLPCGSGIDILLTPSPDAAWIEALYEAQQKRTCIRWTVNLQESTYQTDIIPPNQCRRRQSCNQLTRRQMENGLETFARDYPPLPRIVVFGEGAIFDYFLTLARTLSGEVVAYSKAFHTLSTNPNFSGATSTQHLLPIRTPQDFDSEWLDEWSYLVLLSHDHAWETDILKSALNTKVPYISALGSQKTQKQRLELLALEGISEKDLNRIKGPAGLDLGGQTPPEIALSILAEITSSRNKLKTPAI